MAPVCAEYIWIDSAGTLRSKTRVCLDGVISIWNFDGSSTGQAQGSDSEVIIAPVVLFNDPFKGGSNKLVLCSVHTYAGAHSTNFRAHAQDVFKKHAWARPWFGLEQEYFIMSGNDPLGWKAGAQAPQGGFYCGVGTNNAFGRHVADEHMDLCIKAGVRICGLNAEVAPGQWEFQIGICEGVDAADHLWMARYILERVAEKHGLWINYHPKPLRERGEWNGSGCHINFSTTEMREAGGMECINSAIDKLRANHSVHMEVYGAHNDLRMTGLHETAQFDKFTWGVGDRTASVRIGLDTAKRGCGYFEDRRPGANIDPYRATSKLVETCMEIVNDKTNPTGGTSGG